MKKPGHVSEFLWEHRSNSVTDPNEIEQAYRAVVSQRFEGDLEAAIIAAPSQAKAVEELRRRVMLHPGCGGGGPGSIGHPTYDIRQFANGVDCWFGDTPDRWRYIGAAQRRNGIQGPRLIYVMRDVPPENIRYIRVTLSDWARRARQDVSQPSLFEGAA